MHSKAKLFGLMDFSLSFCLLNNARAIFPTPWKFFAAKTQANQKKRRTKNQQQQKSIIYWLYSAYIAWFLMIWLAFYSVRDYIACVVVAAFFGSWKVHVSLIFRLISRFDSNQFLVSVYVVLARLLAIFNKKEENKRLSVNVDWCFLACVSVCARCFFEPCTL